MTVTDNVAHPAATYLWHSATDLLACQAKFSWLSTPLIIVHYKPKITPLKYNNRTSHFTVFLLCFGIVKAPTTRFAKHD